MNFSFGCHNPLVNDEHRLLVRDSVANTDAESIMEKPKVDNHL